MNLKKIAALVRTEAEYRVETGATYDYKVALAKNDLWCVMATSQGGNRMFHEAAENIRTEEEARKIAKFMENAQAASVSKQE